MAAMKSMMAIALDARPSMEGSVSADEASKLSLGIATINHHIVQRQMSSKTVEFSVHAYGHGMSDNYIYNDNGSCPNVETVCPMGRPSVEDLQRIDRISGGGDDSGDSDIADAVEVAYDSLKRCNAGKKYNRIMLLITDGEFLVQDMGRLEGLVSEMRANEMPLYIALLGHKDPSLASSVVTENGKLLASMAGVTGGVFSVLDNVSDSFYFFAGRPGMTSRPLNYKIPFYISPSVKIRCVYWSKVSKASLPSLKKQAPTYDPAVPDSGAVKRITSYFNPDDPDEEIPFDEKIKGYRYGSQYVPVTGIDEAALKLSSEPMVKLLGFLPDHRVQRQHYMDATMVLQGDPTSTAAAKAISALSLSLRQCKSVALVRFVKRADSDPWLAALIPFASATANTSLMIQRLPCAEDIRDFPFPSLYDKRFGPPNTTGQMEAVSEYVDQMTIRPDDIAVFNPAFPGLVRKVLQNVLPTGDQSKSLIPKVVNPLKGSAEVYDRSEGGLKRVLGEFSLAAVDKKKKKRKIYWSDYDVAATSEDAQKNSSEAATVAESKEAEPEATLTTGSTNPVEDFNKDITTNSKLVQQVAFHNMSNIIVNLIVEGGTSAHYRKAVSCIKALRHAAVTTSNPSSFNQFLSEQIKSSFSSGGRHKKFWDDLSSDPIHPISSEEVGSSDVSAAEASRFYVIDVPADALVSQKMTEAEEDDLFDDLE